MECPGDQSRTPGSRAQGGGHLRPTGGRYRPHTPGARARSTDRPGAAAASGPALGGSGPPSVARPHRR
eukprot:11350133-Alexandrium_andersonii.AAC.1